MGLFDDGVFHILFIAKVMDSLCSVMVCFKGFIIIAFNEELSITLDDFVLFRHLIHSHLRFHVPCMPCQQRHVNKKMHGKQK